MARTPRPADAKMYQFFLSAENHGHIQSLIASLGRNTTEVLARELDFLRTWGLTPIRLPKLLHAARAEFATPMQYVTALLTKSAAQLPSVVPTQDDKPAWEAVRGNVNFSGAAQALVLAHAAERNLSFARSLDELITYARTYALTRGQLATLNAATRMRGGELRDLVLDLIADHVALLPEPPRPTVADVPPRRRKPAAG